MENITNTQNYARDYALTEEHDFNSFFNNYEDVNEKLKPIKKEIKEVNHRIAELQQEIDKIYAQRYNKTFTPTKLKTYLSYDKKDGYHCTKLYFDIDGAPLFNLSPDDEYDIEIHLSTARGSFHCLKGYCLELGAAIFQTYNYSITVGKGIIKLTPTYETIYPILNGGEGRISKDNKGETSSCNFYCPDYIPSKEFIELFYGIEIDPQIVKYKLPSLARRYRENVNVETIIKTAPQDIMSDLLEMRMETPQNIYQMLNVTKNEFKQLKEFGITRKYYKLMELLNKMSDSQKQLVQKTSPEWIKLIRRSLEWETNFNFYGISYNTDGILINLVSSYVGYSAYTWRKAYDKFPQHYSFGNFCSYVIDGVINQGFSELSNFLTQLQDYLNMCEGQGIKPILYSGYLSQTHDIASRNLKVQLNTNQEEVFVNRYKGFKNWEDKKSGYAVIAPKESKDVIQEGSDQSHCCGSYLHKILNGECLILFLRKIENLKQSLITVEYAHGAVIQARGQFNRDMTEEEVTVLKECCKANNWVYDV